MKWPLLEKKAMLRYIQTHIMFTKKVQATSVE